MDLQAIDKLENDYRDLDAASEVIFLKRFVRIISDDALVEAWAEDGDVYDLSAKLLQSDFGRYAELKDVREAVDLSVEIVSKRLDRKRKKQEVSERAQRIRKNSEVKRG